MKITEISCNESIKLSKNFNSIGVDIGMVATIDEHSEDFKSCQNRLRAMVRDQAKAEISEMMELLPSKR